MYKSLSNRNFGICSGFDLLAWLDYQPLFGKGARTPPLGGMQIGLEKAAEIEVAPSRK